MLNQTARILKVIKDDIWIETNNQTVKAAVRGALRTQNIKPTVGDWVKFSNEPNQIIIEEILPRKNNLGRPNVNNVDTVVLVQSTIEPDFNTLVLDKMIAQYESHNCEIIIAVTKADISLPVNVKQWIIDYKMMGYDVYILNDPLQYMQMLTSFKDKVVCFVGNSGVGKSTLINKIEPTLNIRTQEISQALNRGKHTTTNTTLIKCNDFYLIDTPGYSSIEIKFSKHELAKYFFQNTMTGNYCRFDDCFHHANNTGCKVQQLLHDKKITQWRYDNYLEISSQLKDRFS